MRTTSLNGMLTSLATNYNRRNKNVRLYELGNIYLPKALPLTELPDERMQFTLGMYGDGDFFSMKGVVEEFFEKVGLHKKETYDQMQERTSFIRDVRQTSFTMERLSDTWVRFIRKLLISMESVKEHTLLSLICHRSQSLQHLKENTKELQNTRQSA